MGYEISTWSHFLANQAGWDGIWTWFFLDSNEDWPQREMQKTTPKKHKYIRVGRVGDMTFAERSIQWYNCSTSNFLHSRIFGWGLFWACHTVETHVKKQELPNVFGHIGGFVLEPFGSFGLLVKTWLFKVHCRPKTGCYKMGPIGSSYKRIAGVVVITPINGYRWVAGVITIPIEIIVTPCITGSGDHLVVPSCFLQSFWGHISPGFSWSKLNGLQFQRGRHFSVGQKEIRFLKDAN